MMMAEKEKKDEYVVEKGKVINKKDNSVLASGDDEKALGKIAEEANARVKAEQGDVNQQSKPADKPQHPHGGPPGQENKPKPTPQQK